MANDKVVKSTVIYSSGNNVKELVKNRRVQSYSIDSERIKLPKSAYFATITHCALKISALFCYVALLRKFKNKK